MPPGPVAVATRFNQRVNGRDLETVVITGRSECSEPALAGPALWTAIVIGDQVAEWHVHEDTPAARKHLGLPAE